MILISFLFLSCQSEQKDYSFTILENETIDSAFVKEIDEPGHMLLDAYGNECNAESEKPKCQLLNLLGVDNECDTVYIEALKQWFEGDVYRSIKLKFCPILPLIRSYPE